MTADSAADLFDRKFCEREESTTEGEKADRYRLDSSDGDIRRWAINHRAAVSVTISAAEIGCRQRARRGVLLRRIASLRQGNGGSV
jgi:hypothetical protein